MIRPENIDPFVKKLGAEVLGYVLNLSVEEGNKLLTEGLSLRAQQEAVLKEMLSAVDQMQKVAVHQNDAEGYTFFSLSHLTTDKHRHVFNEWRQHAGGRLLSPLTEDAVVHALTTLAIETYPALLMSTSSFFRNRPIGFTSFPPYNHPANASFEEAVLQDLALSKLFPNRGKDAIATGGFFENSTGRGGSLQLAVFASSLINASHLLMKIRGHASEKAFLDSVVEIVSLVRRAANGETVMVPALIGFRNAAFPPGSELKLPFGKITDTRSGLLQLLPMQARPSAMGENLLGFVFETEYPYQIVSSNQQSSMILSDLPRLGFNEAQRRLEKLVENVSLTFALGIKRSEPLGVNHSWTLILDPLSAGMNISWRTIQQTPVSHHVTTEADYGPLKYWSELINSVDTQNIKIAIRRILSAVTNRFDPVDGFIDSIIAWENVFGGKGELRFRVSMAMASLLENEVGVRFRLQKELAELYDVRSDIVHGLKDIPAAEAIDKRNKALNLIIDCLRKLFEERPDLLADKDRSKKILLQGNIGR